MNTHGNSTAPPIGVGFIGTGSIAYMHRKGLSGVPGAHLVGVYNRTRSNAEKAASDFGGCRVYDTAEALLADPSVQAVYVLTHMDTHVAYAKAALAAGKHVLVEKPVAPTVGEIRELAGHAARAGRVCMPVHNYVYEPALWRAKAMLAAGDLGQLVSVTVHYSIHHPESVARNYPGVIRQIMTHHSYILLYLAGKPRRLTAMKGIVTYKEHTEEEHAAVILELAGGALGYFYAGFAADDHVADPWTCIVKVLGTQGGARFSYRDHVSTVRKSEKQIHSQSYEAYQASISETGRYFLESCIRGGREPLSTLEDAITAQQMVDAAETAARDGQAVRLA